MHYVVRYRKKVVRSNLRNAFPELNPKELIVIEKQFYKHFCDVIVESIKFITISQKNIRKRFKIINPEVFESYQSISKSFILYSGHLGNWEWYPALPLYVKIKTVALYLPLRNVYFNVLLKDIRQRFGMELVEAIRAYKALLKYAAANIDTFTVYIADQSPHKGADKHWSKLFNLDTAFNTGISAMAMKLKHVVLFPHFRKVSRGYYEIELIPIWDGKFELKENEIIDLFAVKLEKAIRESPHLWLWTHKRWKLKKEDEEVKN
jgi:KDO2-lipid IV(A) lauroyltransferase